MTEQIVTTLESTGPFIFVEVVDCRIATLQLDKRLLDPTGDLAPDRERIITGAIATAMARHSVDVRGLLSSGSAAEQEVLAFVDEVLGDVGIEDAPRGGPDARARTRARVTGTGSSGGVVVEAGAGGIISVVIPDHVLGGQRREVERAISEATNEALDGADRQFVGRLEAIPVDPEPVDWAALADRIRSIQRMEQR